MALVLASPEDVCNAALVSVGWKKRIGSLYDGSEAAKRALDIYGQARDALLRSFDWGFAERDVALTLLKTAPVGGYIPPLIWSNQYPILPFIYEYACPADYLKLRALRGTPVFIPEYDPKPTNYRIANDNAFVPPQKVILCDLANAICVYTAQVTDPLTWEADFAQALIDDLGKKLAPVLVGLDGAKLLAAEEQADTQLAESRLG